MYWLKQCTKCNGDLASASDQYGTYVSCMQCGRYHDFDAMEAQSPVAILELEEPAVATGSIKERSRAIIARSSAVRSRPAIAV